MWQSRYSSEEILDEDGLVEVFKYITENSVKEGLVDDPGAWKGLHGYHQLVNQRVMSGPWLDRTGLYKAKQNPQTRSQAIPENFTTVYSVNLTPPPLWEEMSEEEYHLHCVKLSEEAIKSAQMKREGASMGMARVLAEDVYKPRRVKHGQRPLCRTKCIELLKAYQAKYFSFKSMFEVAYQQLRDALLSGSSYLGVIFPSEGVSPLGVRSLIQLE